jgi:microcystin-dependent protein
MSQFSFSDLTANLKLVDFIELGYQPNKTNSGAHSIAIGSQTGITNQGTFGIAIGYQAGQLNQSSNAIAIGTNSGQNQQKPFAITLGTDAGQNFQGTAAIALGANAGQNNQKMNAIALGSNAGQTEQGGNSIAIGTAAGQHNQGTSSIAIGTTAGQYNQGTSSIILNASGNTLNPNTSGLFINPVRITDENNNNNILSYKPDTFEVVRQPYPILIGDLKYSLSSIDHNGWLLCDGRLLSINQYPQLFNSIGYSFGGSGNTFALPDPRSRTLGFVGQGAGLSNRTLGQNVGSETHNVNVSELPTHTHTITDPGHTHIYQKGPNITFASGTLIFDNYAANNVFPTLTTSSSTTGITIDNTGGGQPYPLFQPTTFIGNVFIYSD